MDVEVVILAGQIDQFPGLKGLWTASSSPVIPDDGKEDTGLGQGFFELTIEALAGEQVVDIHEDVGGAKGLGQPVAPSSRR